MSYELLVIDQTPYLDDAQSACDATRARIEALQTAIQVFETQDLPAFERWYHTRYGSRLTQLRDLTALMDSKLHLLKTARKRHWDEFFSDDDCACEAEPAAESAHAQFSAGDGFFTFEPEAEELRYQEDSLHDDESASYYDEDQESVRWFEELFVRRSRHGGGYYRSRGPYTERDEDPRERKRSGEEKTAEPRRPEVSAEHRARVKERYRVLVRRLHPDLNPHLSVEARSLWNEVQAAYKAMSVERLDVLLASTGFLIEDSDEDSEPTELSLYQLRQAADELARLLPPLQRKVAALQTHRAWEFRFGHTRPTLERQLDREIFEQLEGLRIRLAQTDSQIARFRSTT